jgi:hypothetical protein
LFIRLCGVRLLFIRLFVYSFMRGTLQLLEKRLNNHLQPKRTPHKQINK